MSIFLFVYGFTIINQSIGLIMAILGLIFLSIFVYVESKAKYPVYNVRVFKNKVFAFSNIASVVSYIATYFIIYILNYHLQYIKGWDPQITGLFLIITPVVQTIISPFSGRLSDRYNPQKLAAFGMLFVTIALFILVFLNKSTSLYVIALAMILQGLGYGIFSSPNTNIIMSSVKLEDTPVASVSVTVMRVVGQTMSLAMLTIIFAVIMGNVPIIPKYYHLLTSSCNLTCIIGTILGIISIMACLVGIKNKTADIE
ncbi:MFS transporter [Methanobrevibacter oralis]|uniref:MFS transporter n=1 Tax=Methanobrevibacter oralis TaxID=66851 RepID=UPI00164CF018|nr:MFS transporter [Methanobrevibacter oralis]